MPVPSWLPSSDWIASHLEAALRSPRSVRWIASFLGILTVATWATRQASPLNTLDRALRWLGIDVTHQIRAADAWLNAGSRHDGLVIAAATLLPLVVGTQAYRKGTWHEERDAADLRGHHADDDWLAATEFRSWYLVWILVAVLAQLRVTSALAVVVGAVVILLIRGYAAAFDEAGMYRVGLRPSPVGATASYADEQRAVMSLVRVHAGVEVLFSLWFAFMTLTALPRDLFTFATEPRGDAKQAVQSDPSAGDATGAGAVEEAAGRRGT
jgi:hypothetical protein